MYWEILPLGTVFPDPLPRASNIGVEILTLGYQGWDTGNIGDIGDIGIGISRWGYWGYLGY